MQGCCGWKCLYCRLGYSRDLGDESLLVIAVWFMKMCMWLGGRSIVLRLFNVWRVFVADSASSQGLLTGIGEA